MAFVISPSPHIHAPASTASIMRDVLIALAPATLVSLVFYGWAELLLVAVCIAACMLTEVAIERFLQHTPSTLRDGSAAVTGLLLALNLPASCPWWVAVIGSVFAIGVVKMTFGGLGQNVFNPAIAARVFLLVSFPSIMTDWSAPASISSAWGFSQVDAVSGATPLGIVSEGLRSGMTLDEIFAAHSFSYKEMLFARVGGSAGELSALALLLGFVYLLARKVIKATTTLSIWATIIGVSMVFSFINPSAYTDPLFNMLTGGVLLGSIFMATDYVTSPMSNTGCVIYGFGIGLQTMLIRYFGAYPEGMSFAILLMNAFVPLINRYCHQPKFGRAK
ncbi:MAG: RnfABCDGE type electron transport complex subunit D [Bacteroidales bacterium]|nr:RnfABCDGE type electron transport complex subunit D [Bacteroidales bacterium]